MRKYNGINRRGFFKVGDAVGSRDVCFFYIQ